MKTTVYFVVNIDSDPDPEDTPRNDDAVMEKYRLTHRLISEHVDGKGTICVHTSPMYRNRFYEERFMDFWRESTEAGSDLTLHPEEDLYATAETRLGVGTRYEDSLHMEALIEEQAAFMNDQKLPFAAYKGGYHGLTMDIVRILEKVGIPIDVTCAPGIVWPEKAASWGNAPKSAYYMSTAACDQETDSAEAKPLFEIPFGWDGEPSDTSKRRLLNAHYLVNEFSNYEAMCAVWNTIVERAERVEAPQTVSLLCHTYAMKNDRLRNQCANILDYMRAHQGTPVTASEARDRYDENFV